MNPEKQLADPNLLAREEAKKIIIIHGSSSFGHIPRPGDAEALQAKVESGKGAKSYKKWCEEKGAPYRSKGADSGKP